MKVEQFVRDSIVQIVNGIVEADAALRTTGAAVNPLSVAVNDIPGGPYGFLRPGEEGQRSPAVERIQFDLAVTTKSASNAGTDRVYVGVVGVSSDQRAAMASRLRFAVPVLIPNSTTS